ncbi:Cytochrome b5 isoform A [Hibiscus syriacus]|uniref:Cytochrome b5 isoform A n=1 Tax=Hibiscus syriacus TaxID=106335 RepID=A0A6A2X0C6_HIBSY|nr:Cytochrome b5 isoform A [Hibiscus syriacus]
MDEHPGGDDVVLAAIGKDATDEFEDAGHSKSAKELMQNFCIGELDTSAPVIPELEISSKKETKNYSGNLMDLTKQYWAVSVAIVGFSVVVGLLFLRRK